MSSTRSKTNKILGENEIDTSENPSVKPSDKTPTSYQDVKDKFNKNLRSSNKLRLVFK
jgi:hypothetical protein